ncbi:hypothetical protein [Streptomyces beigongshangae]|uniref:hypothetical protein n=1 Tax=Streptomyces beigongshangae TaxID=2841597 RepID=UPI001C8416CC|nr:hypothetical protein [Streptomyces sp. REN17]
MADPATGENVIELARKWRTSLAGTLAAAFIMASTGVSAADASASTDASDACVDAVTEASPKGRVNVTCYRGIATVTSKATGRSKTYSYDEMRPFVGYVDGLYRGRTEDDLIYGTIENGQWVFRSTIFVRAIISLGQYQHQWLEIYWNQKDGRDVNLSINAQMKRYIYWPGTDVVEDSVVYTTSYYSKDYKASKILFTEHSDRQIFYYNLTNMVVKDLGQNDTFPIIGDIPGPYFQCYVYAVCSYPNGKPVDP